jgi:hypothetical protein
MGSVQTWGEAIALSLVGLWERLIMFLPSLIGALFVFLAGMVVAVSLSKVVEKAVKLLKVDAVIEKLNLGENFRRSGMKIELSKILGGLVKWFLILVFLMAATDILKLSQVTAFLNNVILYIPNIVVAAVILSIAFILGNFVFNLVRHSTRVAGVVRAEVVATVSKWAIVVFGLLAALLQLGIAPSLVNTIFIGVVAALSLAVGLAFGLGGRDEAAHLLKRLREDLEEKK